MEIYSIILGKSFNVKYSNYGPKHVVTFKYEFDKILDNAYEIKPHD